MKRLLCRLFGHPAGVRHQVHGYAGGWATIAQQDAFGWYHGWTPYRCTRCGAWGDRW